MFNVKLKGRTTANSFHSPSALNLEYTGYQQLMFAYHYGIWYVPTGNVLGACFVCIPQSLHM